MINSTSKIINFSKSFKDKNKYKENKEHEDKKEKVFLKHR